MARGGRKRSYSWRDSHLDEFERAVVAALREKRERDPEIDRLARFPSTWEVMIRAIDGGNPPSRRGAEIACGVRLNGTSPPSEGSEIVYDPD